MPEGEGKGGNPSWGEREGLEAYFVAHSKRERGGLRVLTILKCKYLARYAGRGGWKGGRVARAEDDQR